MQRDPRRMMEDEGVRLRDWSPGDDRKTTCPKCSHLRKRKNRRDPCLSVRIFADGRIKARCHNDGCEWRKVVSPDGEGRGSGGRDYRPSKPEPEEPPRPPERIASVPLGPEALELFEARGIGRETIDAFNVRQFSRWMPKPGKVVDTIVFPYYVLGRLVNRKYRHDDADGKSFMQEPKARKSLYNVDRARHAEEVIVVEGEMDVMALHEAGLPNAVSLPDGASRKGNRGRLEVLKDSGLLAGDRRFVIAGDRDEAGLGLRRDLAKFVGAERCSAVFWPVNFDVVCKDAGDALRVHGPGVVRECVERAEDCAGGLTGRLWRVEPDPDDPEPCADGRV